MPKRILSLINLQGAPFPSFILTATEAAFEPLISAGVLEIDATGRKKALYDMTFEPKTTWTDATRTQCWYHPGQFGEAMVRSVWVESHKRFNSCTNVRDCRTCVPIFKHSKEELGQALANTLIHEVGHLFGLNAKSSFSGATEGGHTPDERNFMFAPNEHPEFVGIQHDSKRTTKRVIRKGENLSVIAYQLGFRPMALIQKRIAWELLYEFKGQDGRSNRDLLRSGDPNLIFPGEEIWVPDIAARRKWRLSIEVSPKSFTKPQIESMTKFVDAGRTID